MYEGIIFEAIQFASEKHKDQKRKVYDYPYITHPLMVFHIVSLYTDDLDVQAAAILHDTVEDTDTTIEDIKERFGDRVTGFVLGLSEDKSLPWPDRRLRYIDSFANAPQEVLLVKAADIICNLTDMVFMKGENPAIYKEWVTDDWKNLKDKEIKTIEDAWPKNPLIDRVKDLYNNLIS